MNATTAIEQGTALALPPATDLAALFKREDGIAGIVAQLEKAARDEAKGYDASTKKGREALKSLAAKVSTSKAEIDRQGKALTEQQRKEIDAVNAGRRIADQRLAALRDEIRKPVTDWEDAEVARVEALKARLERMRTAHASLPADATAEQIGALLARVEAAVIDDTWAEFAVEAALYRDQAIATITHMQTVAIAREEAAAEAARQAEELARLRAEKAAREEADRIKAEQEAAEVRRIEAEKAEAERQARIEQEKKEAAERAAREAEERAAAEAAKAQREAEEREAALKREAEEAEARHQKELAQAKAREEAAAQAERDRIAAAQAAEEEARRKREADQAHRANIRAEIIEALSAMRGKASPEQIADALMAGAIPHTKVNL